MIWQNLKTIFQRRINQINKDDNIKIEYITHNIHNIYITI
jgi:hypothetical protein